MKLIIDIPEEVMKATKAHNLYPSQLDLICENVLNGTPIPDNATNGDVIKALFEPNRITRMDDVVREEYEFNEVWWNAPYQKGGD